ncbi:hypothetical protein KW782_01385 [Candidatus Parcubacteria bacterium]|nr:hypothetical protein [Candidatus Parcubacteria bacterium]
MNNSCATCGKETKGFTCKICNNHFETTETAHADCEGVMEAKCVGCSQAESTCSC